VRTSVTSTYRATRSESRPPPRYKVTPCGIDHTLDGPSDELLNGSLALCGVCALVVAGSAVRRRWRYVVGALLLLILIVGSSVLTAPARRTPLGLSPGGEAGLGRLEPEVLVC
jgi:hypothetical protein